MLGIYPEGHCPVPGCKKRFKREGNNYLCPTHKAPAQRYTISIHFKGERIRRGTTLAGNKTLTSAADAYALRQQAMNEIVAGKFDVERWKSKDRIELMFERQIWKWYEEKEALMNRGKLSPGYVPMLRGYIKNYIEPYFKGQLVTEIFNCKDFIKTLPARLSINYQRNLNNALIGFFRWLKQERIITEVPVFENIEIPEYEPQTLDKGIQGNILEFIPKEHLPIFTFLFRQGARPGEVCALMGDCINGDRVTYKRTFSRRKLREHTKTRTIRHNYIYPDVMAILPTVFGLQFVFTHGQLRRPYSNDYLNRIYRAALTAFNAEYGTQIDVPLYEATKHSFGTQFINEHPEMESLLQAHFGHARPEMTRKYAKLRVVDAFRNLETLRGKKKNGLSANSQQ